MRNSENIPKLLWLDCESPLRMILGVYKIKKTKYLRLGADSQMDTGLA